MVSAIIVAAGNSTRMGVDKQRLLLGGRPVIIHTLSAFEHCPSIDEIVLVTRAEEIEPLTALAEKYGITKLSSVVEGGADRQTSVAHGIACCAEESTHFAIHDGARPLITSEVITRTVETAKKTGAAAAAVRVKDTIKVVNEQNVIIDTPNRDTLWSVQTPQVFEKQVYLHSLAYAEENKLAVTDDCRLAEAAGYAVQLVEGSYRNIKITTPEDIAMAEGLL